MNLGAANNASIASLPELLDRARRREPLSVAEIQDALAVVALAASLSSALMDELACLTAHPAASGRIRRLSSLLAVAGDQVEIAADQLRETLN